jgi:hypothetical protein
MQYSAMVEGKSAVHCRSSHQACVLELQKRGRIKITRKTAVVCVEFNVFNTDRSLARLKLAVP